MIGLVKRTVRLLGPARIEAVQAPGKHDAKKEEQAAPRFRSRRTVALLGYLVAERRAVARDFLAALFWPDEPSSKGRANLRRELYNLAQILPDAWAHERQAVSFAPPAGTTVDLYDLLALQSEARLDEAVVLLGGEFLEGLYLDDNPEFERWLLAERHRWGALTEAILTQVIEGRSQRGRYAEALEYARQLLHLAPWNEAAHHQVMRLLAWTGQRGAALRQFEECQQVLARELGVEPSPETINLCRQVRSGKLAAPLLLPAFLTAEPARRQGSRPLFVAREHELHRLAASLERAMQGRGQVVLVSGGPGRGKTALMEAFSRQSMARHPGLLSAGGSCNAYASVGDPYLPFRDIMAMLTGDVEAKWDAGAISADQARRLWVALPLTVQALLDHGPLLVDVLVSGRGLVDRVMLAESADSANLVQLRQLVQRSTTGAQEVVQNLLFQQLTAVLRAVAKERPLLLWLDDFQWADMASIALLFHLGRRLSDLAARVLIVCAYRPEELAVGRNGRRHPLVSVLNEFKRAQGDVVIELGQSEAGEGRRFIDAFLDSQPNCLGEAFRTALFERTAGHPLFTVELLQTMKERGALLKDERGRWMAGPALDWDLLPTRVEAVIEERVGRLNPELQQLLAVASVEGEVFTAQVIARVLQHSERATLRLLAAELERRHRLVREQEEILAGHSPLVRFRFGHVLFQAYLYRRLSPAERRLLHADVAEAIEALYEDRLDEVTVQLGHHFCKAGEDGRALPYLTMAAERAAQFHASNEAISHYSRAIELAARQDHFGELELARLYRGRGLARERLGDIDAARADLDLALAQSRQTGEQRMQWRLLLDLGKVWASSDYKRTLGFFERALELAYQLDDPTVLGSSLNRMGNWYANAEYPAMAIARHQEALAIFQEAGDQEGLAVTLDLLGIASLLSGDLSTSVGYYDRAIELFEELEDRPRLLSSLMGRGTIVSLQVLSVTAPATPSPNGPADIEAAVHIAQEIHSPQEEAWACWTQGLLHSMHGQFGHALALMHRGLNIAAEIGHREWTVGNHFALGVLYLEMLVPEVARLHLEQALEQAKGLQSLYWINHVGGALASTYYLMGDFESAETCLRRTVSTRAPMNTMGRRYCWLKQAELALLQGNAMLAIEIVDRLIDSTPSLPAEGVITFLWKLKADALVAIGEPEQAEALLHAALMNARAQKERFLLWRVHASLGKLYRALSQQDRAEQAIAMAREHVAELANTVPDNTLRNNFLERAYYAFTT